MAIRVMAVSVCNGAILYGPLVIWEARILVVVRGCLSIACRSGSTHGRAAAFRLIKAGVSTAIIANGTVITWF